MFLFIGFLVQENKAKEEISRPPFSVSPTFLFKKLRRNRKQRNPPIATLENDTPLFHSLD